MKRSTLLILFLINFIGFCMTAFFVVTTKDLYIDKSLISLLQRFESNATTKLMIFFTEVGSFNGIIIIYMISVLLLLYFRDKKSILLLTLMIISTPIVNSLLKQLFTRERPNVNQLIDISGYSFPSGHTMHAVSIFGMLIYIISRSNVSNVLKITCSMLFILIILFIAISRIYLGVHYPSDVIGGAFVSICLIIVSILIVISFFNRIDKQKTSRSKA